MLNSSVFEPVFQISEDLNSKEPQFQKSIIYKTVPNSAYPNNRSRPVMTWKCIEAIGNL